MALLELAEELANATDKNKSSVSVFIDLKKAFDISNYHETANKLNILKYYKNYFKYIHLYK